jgi:hypothetical protein
LAGSSEALPELKQRIDGIEEAYEFMLAYAAQGLSTHEGSKNGSQLHDYLGRLENALSDLGELFRRVVEEDGTIEDAYIDFIGVLDDDSRKARSAIRLVLAQGAISSQLIDNLNASIHLRAMLTDVFLLDEVISPRVASTPA